MPPPLPPPRPLLSPSFSRSAFPAAAAANDAAVSEHPCVTLLEWWLERVEGDDRKIAVGGVYLRNQTLERFDPAPIAKRHEACVLETEGGIVVFIDGSLGIDQTLGNDFPIQACEAFMVGFPHWWESFYELYPKTLSSHTTSQPSSCNPGNSQDDSTRFYLKKFQEGKLFHLLGSSLIGNPLRNATSYSGNDADVFPDSSLLSNGTPRFEEYTYDDDIPTTEKAAALNDESERYAAVCNEVDNMEMDLIAGSTSRERGHGGIDTNVSLTPTVECTNDEGNERADNIPHKSEGRQKTPAASMNCRGCWKKPQCISLNEKAVLDKDMPTSAYSDVQSPEKPVGPLKEQRSVHEKLQSAIISPSTIIPASYAHPSSLTRGRTMSLSMSIPESLKLRKTRSGRVVVPKLDAGCQRIVYEFDGSISCLVGPDSPSLPKGNKLKTYVRRKKMAH
uniref:SANTA domain-containing protein n=1 Tax=Arundo donax TaxID=35708 RepID=A0A0A9GIP9_ARUDO